MKMKNKFNLRYLRITLKYRPEILKLILKLKACNNKNKNLIKKLTKRLYFLENGKQENQGAISNETQISPRKESSTQCEIQSLSSLENTVLVHHDSQSSEIKIKDASTQYEIEKLQGNQHAVSNETHFSSRRDSSIQCEILSPDNSQNVPLLLLARQSSEIKIKDASTQCENVKLQENQNAISDETHFSLQKESSIQCEILSPDNSQNVAPVQLDSQSSENKVKDTSIQCENVKLQENQDAISDETHFSLRKESSTQCEILSPDNSQNVAPVQFDSLQSKSETNNASIQTENAQNIKQLPNENTNNKIENSENCKKENENSGWNINEEKGQSIADQVKEAAQNALKQSGMVYVESAGMYYDYKTGYYYHSELGLYYHTDTGCYYYYNDDKQEFVFHSYPDRRATAQLEAHERRKARKHKKVQQQEDIDALTKNMAKDKEDEATKPKRKKTSEKSKKHKNESAISENSNKEDGKNDDLKKEKLDNDSNETDAEMTSVKEDSKANESKKINFSEEGLEDGECSMTESENDDDDDDLESNASTATDESVVKHQPPCMRVIVRETTLPKLKVGTLFLVTKDGGTVGREGDHHAILLRDSNVSRNHLNITYDIDRRKYFATDLGSKNGTLLNGVQMSESQVVSKQMEIVHGSTVQVGETKLLCHIHQGNDTCGHCEPGLIMETLEKEKVAYTRTCSVKKQHELELARLKNKYKPAQKAIEATAYRDRAQQRRETAGSSHHAEKTLTADVNTYIAPENKGFKMLEKMGWSKGEGLGKDSQGDTEPVPLVNNEGKAGVGAVVAPTPAQGPRNTLGPATMRLAAKSKLLQPPAKAFQQDDDDDDEQEPV